VIRIKLTNEERNLEFIGSVFCEQYKTEARFFIERPMSLRPCSRKGARHLVVQYGEGHTGRQDLAVAANGRREFASMIPHDWNNDKLLTFLYASAKNPNLAYPTWEVPARVHGRPFLFDFEELSGEPVRAAG
jgi:hypothetical protein